MAKAEHKIRVDLGQLLTVVNDSLLVMSVTHVKNKQCSGYVQTMPVDFKTVSAMHEFYYKIYLPTLRPHKLN